MKQARGKFSQAQARSGLTLKSQAWLWLKKWARSTFCLVRNVSVEKFWMKINEACLITKRLDISPTYLSRTLAINFGVDISLSLTLALSLLSLSRLHHTHTLSSVHTHSLFLNQSLSVDNQESHCLLCFSSRSAKLTHFMTYIKSHVLYK